MIGERRRRRLFINCIDCIFPSFQHGIHTDNVFELIIKAQVKQSLLLIFLVQMADRDHVELPSMSSHHEVNEPENQQNLPLDPNRLQEQPSYRRYLKSKNIVKFAILLLLFSLIIWMGSKFFSDEYMRTRTPASLSSFNFGTVHEAMAPSEKDYRSFYFYEKMRRMAKNATERKKDPLPEQIQEFNDIKFKQFYNIFKVVKTIELAKQFNSSETSSIVNNIDLKEAINYTEYFNEAVDQYQCGSCYSFPITATVEFLYKKLYNITVKLSEQQLIDCVNEDEKANGCDDGDIQKGFQYVQDHGLVSSEDYPYQSFAGKSFKCDKDVIDNKNITKYKISGFYLLPKGNCTSIQEKLQQGKTVATMINAQNINEAGFEDKDVFTDCKRSGLNHAVTIVGQTQENSWIVRNSWGKGWGKNGYFVMGHGNTCGACLYSIAPELRLKNESDVQSVMNMEQIKKLEEQKMAPK